MKKIQYIGCFEKLGNSIIIRIPLELLKECNMHLGDYVVIEKIKDGIFIRLARKEDFKKKKFIQKLTAA